MKIIDNKSLRLLNVLESSITSETSVYYSGSYFTSFSLFNLLPTFKKVKSIKFLLNFSEDSNPSIFINNESSLTTNKINGLWKVTVDDPNQNLFKLDGYVGLRDFAALL